MVINGKNILNRGNKTDRAPATGGVPAGAAAGGGGADGFPAGDQPPAGRRMGQYGWWSTELGARWARDSLEEDWQDTAAFRTIICNWLDACLTAGTWEYTSGGDYGKELLDGLEGDKNLLYAVARRGVSCTPTPRTAASSPPVSRRRGTASRCAVRTEWCPLPRTAGNWMYMGTAGTPRTTCGRPRL